MHNSQFSCFSYKFLTSGREKDSTSQREIEMLVWHVIDRRRVLVWERGVGDSVHKHHYNISTCDIVHKHLIYTLRPIFKFSITTKILNQYQPQPSSTGPSANKLADIRFIWTCLSTDFLDKDLSEICCGLQCYHLVFLPIQSDTVYLKQK